MSAGNKKLGKFAASIVELFNRSITVSGHDKIYNNDDDNLYPNRVELIERNSPTAAAASNKLKSFIIGRGFADELVNDYVFNRRKNINGYKLLNLIAGSLKTHKGVFLHVNYDIEGKVNYVDVLDYKKCRISKEDDLGFSGRIFYADWDQKKSKNIFTKDEGDIQWFYPFNPAIEVINEQRKRDVKLSTKKGKSGEDVEQLIKSYRGQVLFLNLDDMEKYPYAWLHPAYNDADSEYRISLYRNSNLRTGFLGKNIIIANGLDAEDTEAFEHKVKDWLGAENSSSVFVMQPDEVMEDPEKVITVKELKSTYDSKRFLEDESAVANNIRKAYLSIPKILIDPEDNFFGSSGEAFKQAVSYYNSETLFIRDRVTDTLKLLGLDLNFEILELGGDDVV